MHIGVTLRNMGPQSERHTLLACARAAQAREFESIWITDHIAIPPDDAEGSGGRYLDTLTCLAWLAGVTEHINLGSGVLILPYRAALPTAKQVATVQELAAGRLLLGVGVGWMDAEFRALGIDRRARGMLTDQTLEFLRECFGNDVVRANGQDFLFRPRPPAPPILVGGRAPHALTRAARLGDGWLPMARSPEQLRQPILDYERLCEAHDREGSVTVLCGLPLDSPDRAARVLDEYAALGVARCVCAVTYDANASYVAALDQLSAAQRLR